MPDYSEVKNLLAEEIRKILALRGIVAQVTIATVRDVGSHFEAAEIGKRLTIEKDQVRGLVRFKNWSATFHLQQTTSTKPEHLREQFILALRGEVKVQKKRAKKKAQKKTSSTALAVEDVDSATNSKAPPEAVADASQVVAVVEPKPYSPVLLGKHKIPLLEVLTSFVLLVEDIGGSMESQGICRAIADTLGGAEAGVDPRSLSSLLRSLVTQGLFGTKGQDYFLTPFGQLVYATLSKGTCVPGEIDWGKVLSNKKLDLGNTGNRDTIFAVMAAEHVSYFTTAQSGAVDEVEKLTQQLEAAKRRQAAAKAILAYPTKLAKTSLGLDEWRSAIAERFIDDEKTSTD